MNIIEKLPKELITKVIEHKINILANDIYKNYENASKQNMKLIFNPMVYLRNSLTSMNTNLSKRNKQIISQRFKERLLEDILINLILSHLMDINIHIHIIKQIKKNLRNDIKFFERLANPDFWTNPKPVPYKLRKWKNDYKKWKKLVNKKIKLNI